MSTQQEMKAVQKVKKYKQKLGGIVCKWIPSKGYGFIRIPDQEEDVYVHSSDIIPEERVNLNIGEIVTFYTYTSKKTGRVKAIRVKGNGAGFTVNEEAGFTGVCKFLSEPFPPLLNIFKHIKNNNEKVKHDNVKTNMNAKATQQVNFEEVETTATSCVTNQANDKSIAHHFQEEEEDLSVKLKPEELQLWENFKALHTSIRDTSVVESDDGRQTAQTYADAQDKCIFPQGRSSNFSQVDVPPMYMSRASNSDSTYMRQSGTYLPDPSIPFLPVQLPTIQQDMLYMSNGMPMDLMAMQNMPMPMQNMQPMVPILNDNLNMMPMNVMNPPMIPMDGYTHLRGSYGDGYSIFPTSQNIQVEQVPYVDPNMGMRASFPMSMSGMM